MLDRRGKTWPSALWVGLGEQRGRGAGLPAQARVKHELGHGCRGVLPVANRLDRLAPQWRDRGPAHEIRRSSRRPIADGRELPVWVDGGHPTARGRVGTLWGHEGTRQYTIEHKSGTAFRQLLLQFKHLRQRT